MGLCSTCGADEVERVCVACAFEQALEPQVVGRYRLLSVIGAGGMGEVWLAEQSEPIRRRVALKVIKAGMDTQQVIARFEAERQALALMDHPNVSKVLDAGATDEGKPYFVMEYVEGEPITEYADRRCLALDERLELFAQVCDGVQHAHHKALIHRDLKPSNVLVAERDGAAVPKIIDFGVAKATEQRLTEKTLLTEAGVVVGTPEYMSPEQVDPDQDVDTRTDVYSLGVILYELLTGVLPFEASLLRKGGLEGLTRAIREVTPPRPSSRVAAIDGDRALEIARFRGIEPPALRRFLTGDLDWIAMKALEKERERRYGSPAELAEDVRRHLRREPVRAASPSALYLARKFVSRHRFGVAAGALAVLGLAAFALTTSVQAARVRREAESKRRVSEFLTQVFQVADPSEARGNSVTAREILDAAVGKIRRDLAAEPRVQVELMTTMGSVYHNLGLFPEAEPLLREAIGIAKREWGPDHPEGLRAASYLGRLLEGVSRDEEAEKVLSDTLARQKRVLGAEHPDTLFTMGNLGRAYWGLHRGKEAEALLREALDIARRVLGPEHIETLRSMHGLGLALNKLQRFQEAEAVFTETLALRKRTLGPDHPHTINTMMHLGLTFDNLGRRKDYEAMSRETLAIGRRVYGPRHHNVVWTMVNLAGSAAADGRRDEAMAYLRDAVDNGFSEWAWLIEHSGVRAFKGDPDFEAILAAARANGQASN